MTGRTIAAVALAAVSVGWLDPHATGHEASRLYTAGKFDDAAGKYNEALVDQPDSPVLHFNLGDTLYRQGKFTEAVNALQQVPGSDADTGRTARVAYNIGNAKYRLGQAAESSDPKAALGLYAEALAAYRRAMGAAPDDADAKFNHEFVEKKMADLKKKLEEQQKKQQQQQENQDKQDEAQQDQPSQQQKPEPEGDRQNQQQDQQQQQAGEQQQQQQQQQAAAGQAGEKKDGEMSKAEAAALLDAQRDQEVRPDEVVKKLQGAGVVEAPEDW